MFPADGIAPYNAYYTTLDPTRRFMESRSAGCWYHDVNEYGRQKIRQDCFYQDFLRVFNMGEISCVKLYEHNGSGSYLSLVSAYDGQSPKEQQQQLLYRLAKHLTMAGRLFERVQQLNLEIDKRDLLLNQHRTPLWLVNGRGQLFFCNQAAEQRLREPGFTLYLHQNRLTARHSAGPLSNMLLIASGKQGPTRASWIRLAGTIQRELLVTPVNAEARFNLSFQQPLVLVALLENQPRSQLLAELFQLTPAETRLAELVALGYMPDECAARLGISINTVRTHLRGLFRKTDTARQVELAGLFARLNR
ncbi:helix-turn-helix transcriptional regulator [Azomonas macrocytogenes]|uniref:DNA-binding CsgD family transcriptional regulator n=1 Tax=Azomonas macrocytogenes TaxID=69962 RepID=A0A839T0W3_AZOMA|nr:helix-turn-helix transcriptional regulator [Azomonas macrocytogenes]MBB3102146.1 DNA-binding CsgD family transcriptional regulator [Azomonas macrocytogenes]